MGHQGLPPQDLQAAVVGAGCGICLFCPAERKQTAPISTQIFFPFGRAASKEHTMRSEIIKRTTKAGRNEALSFFSGFSAHTLQELRREKKNKRRRKEKKKRNRNPTMSSFSMVVPAGKKKRITPLGHRTNGHQDSILRPKGWAAPSWLLYGPLGRPQHHLCPPHPWFSVQMLQCTAPRLFLLTRDKTCSSIQEVAQPSLPWAVPNPCARHFWSQLKTRANPEGI